MPALRGRRGDQSLVVRGVRYARRVCATTFSDSVVGHVARNILRRRRNRIVGLIGLILISLVFFYNMPDSIIPQISKLEPASGDAKRIPDVDNPYIVS